MDSEIPQFAPPKDPHHQKLSQLLGGTAAYPSLANPIVQINGYPLLPGNPTITPPTHFQASMQPEQSPPAGLPLNVPSQHPALDELDEAFSATPHHWLGAQGRKNGGYNEEMDEEVTKKALEALDKHIADRTPYIHLASTRLQAAMGIRNEQPFELPISPANTFGSSRNAEGGPSKGRKDSGIGLGLGVMGPVTLGMHVVDQKTGKGLREFLLQKGKEQGHKKRSCRSISFHDITPDIRTQRHQNILLGHYAGEGSGERVDSYEVNLPTVKVDPETGVETQSNEPWLWILISRPLLSFDVNNRSTYVADPIEASPTTVPTHPGPPPNFPHPLPTSWVIFAAPLAHLTTYPTQTETLPPGAPKPTPFPFPSTSSQKIAKRTDYDFSHSGIPLFEFSSSTLFAGPALNFLSVDGIGPFYPSDSYEEYTDEEYSALSMEFNSRCAAARDEGKSKRELEKEELVRSKEYESDEEEAREMNGGVGVKAPARGRWWEVFYQSVYRERGRWKAIRRAMGRAKCRVVVRWWEWETAPLSNQARESQISLGGVMGQNGGMREEMNGTSGNGVGDDVEMQDEGDMVIISSTNGHNDNTNTHTSKPSRKQPKHPQPRVTRAETRRRSGPSLGLGPAVPEGGLSESVRRVAGGNGGTATGNAAMMAMKSAGKGKKRAAPAAT